MSFEVKTSQLQDRAAYEQSVADFVSRLNSFATEVGKPRPVAHPLIEGAVKRISYPKADKKPDTYVADYVIVDDSPPPPPPLSLHDTKQMLRVQLIHAENAAKEKLLPFLKRRLLIIQFQNASAKKEDERSAEDNELIAEYLSKQSAMAAIELVAAQAESTLEDLTEDNIDSWQIPNFG